MSNKETAKRFADILLDTVLGIDPNINFRWQMMFGGAGYFANDRMFAGLFSAEGISLKLSEQECDNLLQISGTRRTSKHYVEVPQSLLTDVELMADWTTKSIEYVQSLPAKKRRK
jgi:TfoX/Sxy family transcriptional regulator of competence genes